MSNHYDIHCHFFNGDYAFRELLEITWRAARNVYPYTSSEASKTLIPEKRGIAPDLKKLIDYISGFFSALVQNPEENYRHELECYQNSQWQSLPHLVTTPLMMDIYFIFDDGSNTPKALIPSRLKIESIMPELNCSPLAINDKDKKNFMLEAERLKQEVLAAWKESKGGRLLESREDKRYSGTVEQALDRAIEEFTLPWQEEKRSDLRLKSKNTQMTSGFSKHLKELAELQQANPTALKPFLAVDPRRISIIDLAQKLIVEERIFKGIKLYPPLGYLPTHPNLFPIYELCIKHDIPITTHTSPGGLPTLCSHLTTYHRNTDGSIEQLDLDFSGLMKPSDYFANPSNWRPLLESDAFRNLRVNFAHFGGKKSIEQFSKNPTETNNWTAEIVKLMQKYPNVYADFSYCPSSDTRKAIDKIIADHPRVGDKLMFGTDFVMIMMNYDLGSLSSYFDNYTNIDQRLCTTNPLAFLSEQP